MACSVVDSHHKKRAANASATLYVHFGYETYDKRPDSIRIHRLLSGRIHPGETIFLAGDDYVEHSGSIPAKLSGSIELRGTNLVADLLGSTGGQSQFYRGVLKLESPSFGQGGAASGGVLPLWFAVSTNSDCGPILENLKKMAEERLERNK